MSPPREYTDPAVYNDTYAKFDKEGLPKSTAGWIERAHEVSVLLARDAGERDVANKGPRAEVALLKSSGLLKVIGPKKYGGGGEPWSTALKCIREICKGDGSIGMLLGYHLLWSTTASIEGTEAQKDGIQRVIMENNYFVGGAVNPRDNDLTITEEGDELVFNGSKSFNTGGAISDLIVLEGVIKGTESHIFTFVKTAQPGMIFAHNWNAVGMRLTESGSVKIEDVRVPWSDALGWDPVKKQTIPAVVDVAFASMLLPNFQLIFCNIYLGVALGALHAGSAYTRATTRAWPYGGEKKESGLEEFYILERYGSYRAHLAAAETLCDYCGQELDRIFSEVDEAAHAGSTNGNTNGSSEGGDLGPGRHVITARRRGEFAALVSHAKVVTVDTGLEVTSGIFEILGARATAKKYAFDRYWRDIRTHSLHDPIAYKRREVGKLQLLDEIPEPSWYN